MNVGQDTFTASSEFSILALCAGGAIFAPWLAPHDRTCRWAAVWDPPSAEHWLGLDQISAATCSRACSMAGGSPSAWRLLATLLAFVIGVVTRPCRDDLRRLVDMLFSRVADVVLSVPNLIFALIILSGSAPGAGIIVLIHRPALFDPRVSRRRAGRDEHRRAGVCRGRAGLRGEGLFWVILREILPNALPPLAAEFGLRFCFAFLFVAALSFLGLGVQPPDADWGSMVRESSPRSFLGIAAPLIPAAAIARADHRRQPGGRLAAVDVFTAAGRKRVRAAWRR